MAYHICTNCGGEYVNRGGKDICRSCGACRYGRVAEAVQAALANAAQTLREGRFEEAETAFDELITKYPALSEAYWGRVKARYRIRYMQTENGKAIPIFDATEIVDLHEDQDYQKALQYASEENKDFLKKQAEYIRNECNESEPSGASSVNDNRARKNLKVPIILSAFLSSALILATIIGFLTGAFHKHTPGPWKIITLATLNQEGLRVRKCTVCGKVLDKKILPSRPSEGLGFRLQADGTYLVSGIGLCEDTEIIIPATYKGGRVIGINNDAFRNCSELRSIVIPDGVTSIGDYAFYNCNSLTSIVIPDGVTGIGDYVFDGCESLTEISVHENNAYYGSENGVLFNKAKTKLVCYPVGKKESSYSIPKSVTSIGYSAFRDCSSLTSIVIPESVTSIENSAFYDCISLTSIEIPESVTSIGDYAFRGCSSLTSIVIPESVTSIGRYAFRDCSSLTSIEIPESVTSIGDYAFRGCSSLTSIEIPESVTSIGNSAFYDCSGLTSIVIPEKVTSIGNSTFYGCSGLTSIAIPEKVTRIDYSAFEGCRSLTTITFGGTTAQWSAISFGSSWNAFTGDYTVTCTDGTVSKSGVITYH